MHKAHSLVFLSACTALSLTGCFVEVTPEPEPLPEPAQPLATSFAVTATLSSPSDSDPYGLPDAEDLLLRLDDTPDGGVAAVFASSDGSSSGTFARTSKGISLREPIDLRIFPRERGTDDAHLAFDAMSLTLIDSDGDDSPDAVEGTASGTFSHLVGDVQHDAPFTAELSGNLDTSTPDLYLGATDKLHVLNGLTLLASKPLQLPSKAQIWVGDEVIPLQMFPDGASYVTELHTKAILPFASEVGVRIEPTPRDLAGAEVEDGLERIETMEDPGLFAEDGFEGEPAAVSRGVELVTGFSTLPAMGGTRSLLLTDSTSTLTMRVPIAEGDTHLRLQVRALFSFQFGYRCAERAVRVGFPALDQIQTLQPSWDSNMEEPTGDERWSGATPVATVEVALPEGAGSELIFDIGPPRRELGSPCDDYGLLIDDVRVE